MGFTSFSDTLSWISMIVSFFWFIWTCGLWYGKVRAIKHGGSLSELAGGQLGSGGKAKKAGKFLKAILENDYSIPHLFMESVFSIIWLVVSILFLYDQISIDGFATVSEPHEEPQAFEHEAHYDGTCHEDDDYENANNFC